MPDSAPAPAPPTLAYAGGRRAVPPRLAVRVRFWAAAAVCLTATAATAALAADVVSIRCSLDGTADG